MTKLNYLEDTYLFQSTATFIEARENPRGKAVILDATIFYPQGGGQPADIGKIYSASALFLVSDVRLDEAGEVLHFGEFEHGMFQSHEQVHLAIDKERRVLNSKLHSAGHLIDCAVEKMGATNLIATKGYHFPDGPSVEYDGVIENPENFAIELERIVNDLITENLPLIVKNIPPVRLVNFQGFSSCGCGGTQVKSAAEIGHIKIRKIKSKQGKTKISYNIFL
jgi:Ser-tRNA(Ala) deacylase AlaX